MKTLTVGLEHNRYDILIGTDILSLLGARLPPLLRPGATVVAVSDRTVWGLYGERLTDSLQTVGISIEALLLEPGEQSKSLRSLERLYRFFAEAGLNRSGLVIAFGGGVVGDVTGFAAATYMRGVDYIQIPTTLLAQVDSSVGGKTAVNLEQGKNLAGAFYQPRLVLADIALLDTLPKREWRCGIAEVAKYGAIRSPELADALCGEGPAMTALVEECCRIKAGIVEQDERDTGKRMLLNFGHTFGHAIEALGGFERFNHGEAVAMGMMTAAAVGEALGITEAGNGKRLGEVLAKNGLDVATPYPTEELIHHMRLDKKGSGKAVKLILLRKIGQAVVNEIEFAALEAVMKETEALWKRQG